MDVVEMTTAITVETADTMSTGAGRLEPAPEPYEAGISWRFRREKMESICRFVGAGWYETARRSRASSNNQIT